MCSTNLHLKKKTIDFSSTTLCLSLRGEKGAGNENAGSNCGLLPSDIIVFTMLPLRSDFISGSIFIFLCFFLVSMLMYDNEYKIKENVDVLLSTF